MLTANDFFGKERVALYHGSSQQVRNPQFGVGNPRNDYGLAFYATELSELAFEWACPGAQDGWANKYVLETAGLTVLDLNDPAFTVLNWMAVLLENRRVSLGIGIAAEARSFIVENYGVDLSQADIVHGYRADDSYFHVARSFLSNRIPVEVLEQALFLGGLGYQVAIRSQKAFGCLSWSGAELAAGRTWHPRRMRRDAAAREAAARLERKAIANRSGCYIVDIMRGADPWQR